MILLFPLAIQVLNPPASPEVARITEDIVSMERVDALEVTKPLLRCVSEKAERYRPKPNEVGSMQAAADFANSQLIQCGYDRTRARLIKAIREQYSRVDELEAGKRADSYLSLTVFAVQMLAGKTFKIDSSMPSPDTEVTSSEEKNAQNR